MSNPIIQKLSEYISTQEELVTLARIGGANRLDHRRGRYLELWQKISQFDLPDQNEAVAACLEELQHLAGEAQRLLDEHRAALQGELEARKTWSVAEVVLSYAEQHHILAIGVQAARRDVRKNQTAFEAASRKCQELQVSRWKISDYTAQEYPGADLKNPATFEAAVQARIERIYSQPALVAEAF